MIKATELRIGNKIKIGNVITTVTGGHLDYCGDKTEVKEFYPIPLTPEILEKAGFEKWKHGNTFEKVFDTGVFQIQTDVMESFVGGHESCVTGMGFVSKITHLHQLQNLYFALTGEELVIKEETPA